MTCPPTGLAREAAALTKLSLLHVWGDPLKYRDLEAKVNVERFNCAIVLCDGAWVDPDQVGSRSRSGELVGSQRGLLRALGAQCLLWARAPLIGGT